VSYYEISDETPLFSLKCGIRYEKIILLIQDSEPMTMFLDLKYLGKTPVGAGR